MLGVREGRECNYLQQQKNLKITYFAFMTLVTVSCWKQRQRLTHLLPTSLLALYLLGLSLMSKNCFHKQKIHYLKLYFQRSVWI